MIKKKQDIQDLGGDIEIIPLVEDIVFSRRELLGSSRFVNRKDALCAVVLDGECVTLDEADLRILNFLKRKVI